MALFVTGVMEAMAVAKLILTYKISIPDILGFVGVLIHGNRYFEAENIATSTAQDGTAVADKLGDEDVIINVVTDSRNPRYQRIFLLPTNKDTDEPPTRVEWREWYT